MSHHFFLPFPSESLHLTRSFIAAETKQRFRFIPFVYAEIGGILLPHTNTLFRGYKSKLFSLSKKSKSPIVRIPSSFRRGMMWFWNEVKFFNRTLKQDTR